jgi:signal transduction histidine kinase/DNA-binding NarL/FixJ family response regulator
LFSLFVAFEQTAAWSPNVTRDEREGLESEARAFYQEFYPDIDYQGFIGLEPDPDSDVGFSLQKRSEQPSYFPIHLVEPVTSNQLNIDFDMTSYPSSQQAIDLALKTWKPAVSEVSPRDGTATRATFLLVHPGIRLSALPDLEPQDLAVLEIRVEALIVRATKKLSEGLAMYIYDTTMDDREPLFLSAAEAFVNGETTDLIFQPEISLSDLRGATVVFFQAKEIQLASAKWTVAVVALEDTFQPVNIQYIILTGKMILVASLCLALWIWTNLRRSKAFIDIKRQADNEKAQLIVRNARETARAEQELNDYIAHEVRNPLAAAMSACSFVKTEVDEKEPLVTKDSIQSVREDVGIIDASLRYINDLLRQMLDMHKAASNMIALELVPMDVLEDILKPVAAMLYHRDAAFDVLTECPDNMFVMTDRLRLKQIILNLGRNSAKFVKKGYVKLGAEVVDGNVHLFVEDSGPGIPVRKRKNLFAKFQESLDLMDQGTGIGLSLCKQMSTLLNGEISLDETFVSEIEGSLGSRFVMNLKIPPMTPGEYESKLVSETPDSAASEPPARAFVSAEVETSRASRCEEKEEENIETETPCGGRVEEKTKGDLENQMIKAPQELPSKLSVLFVDDDLVLRKLFTRSLRRVAPQWDIQEASSGESAVRLVEDNNGFDLMFIDQYMASVERQMLGTETTRALRMLGVTSLICGLSANDVEEAFMKAGADLFMHKPFPCDAEALKRELLNVIHSKRNPILHHMSLANDTSDTSELSNHTSELSNPHLDETRGLLVRTGDDLNLDL